LRGVDRAHRHADTEPVERGLVEQKDALKTRIFGEEFDRVGLAGLGVDELLVADLVAGGFEKPQRFAQIVAHVLRIAVDRVGVSRGEYFGGDLVAHAFEDFELAPLRQPGGGEFEALEIAGDARVLPEENLLVHLLEIERVIESPPDARILKLGAAGIEGESLHQAGIIDRKFFAQHALVGDRREIVGHGPVLGAVLVAPVDRIGLERFERHGGVAKIFEAQFFEIIAADIDVEVLAPIVLDAFEDDGAAGREVLDAVSAAAERRLERGFAGVALLAVFVGAFPPCFGQDDEFADDLRQLVVAGTIEGEGDLAIAGLLDFDGVPVICGIVGAVFLEHREGKNHVLGRHRRAVVPLRFGAQPVGD